MTSPHWLWVLSWGVNAPYHLLSGKNGESVRRQAVVEFHLQEVEFQGSGLSKGEFKVGTKRYLD